MPRISHDDSDRVLACPTCDHAGDIYQRTGNGNAWAGDPNEEYRCQKCGATFSEPVDREARPSPIGKPGNPYGGMPARYEPVTDGGFRPGEEVCPGGDD